MIDTSHVTDFGFAPEVVCSRLLSTVTGLSLW